MNFANLDWTVLPDLTAIPTDGVVHARTSDNVLDDEDWNTYQLTLEGGVVRHSTMVQDGCYGDMTDDFIGMTREQVKAWCLYDDEHHPASCQEISL